MGGDRRGSRIAPARLDHPLTQSIIDSRAMSYRCSKVVSQVLLPLRGLVSCLGLNIVQTRQNEERVLPDIEPEDAETLRFVRPYTMTSAERVHALCAATRYITRAEIPGAIVECGVWRGGSMMAVARTLLRLGSLDRELYLFDTFEGMTAPGVEDVAWTGESAADLLEGSVRSEEHSVWCYAPLDRVRQAMVSTGYPPTRMHFVPGRVEETLANFAPDRISLLRLDTDWFESTRHELEQLFPRLSRGGVLIVDDYGHWQGARRAVDEYLSKNKVNLLLTRVDYTGRLAIKVFD